MSTVKKTNPHNDGGGMAPEDIMKALILRDVLLADIAEALDVSVAHVSNVIKGKGVSHSVQKAICLAINEEFSVVFGNKISRAKSGKERITRKKQVIDAIRAGQSVPFSN